LAERKAEWDQPLGTLQWNGTIFAAAMRTSSRNLRGGIMTTDPVCGMKINESDSEFHSQFGGRKYSFCSEECKKEFEADPEEFVETSAVA
jgi:YHS domain-containing protein